MADYQRVVEFLRDFRGSTVQTVTEEVREAAAEYARLCTSANDRLRQCNVLLQRGLRSEAINLAEASPNLLDLVAALDLPDPEGWSEFCQRSDLEVPPSLQIDRAAALNDAYNQDQPLEQLFSKHRRLALAQAPVLERLQVMREIAGIDPSPFWEKDIRLFEGARFKELRVNFATAIRDKDTSAVQTLASEVLESPWMEPPPPDLQTAANEVAGRVQLTQFQARLNDLLGRLRDAFATRSLPECTSLLAKIKKLPGDFGQAGLTPEAMAQTQQVIAWVQQENQLRQRNEQFAAACTALETAMNTAAPDREVDAAYHAAKAFDEPLPLELEDRYAAALKSRARAVRWKYSLAAAALLAVMAGGFFVWQSMDRANKQKEWATKIRQAAVDQDLTLAHQLIEQQERIAPDASHAPEVAAAKQEVAVLSQRMQEQAQAFQRAAGMLDDGVRNAAAVSADNNATFEQLRAAQAAADALITRYQSGQDKVAGADRKKRLDATAAQLVQLRDDLKARAIRLVLSQAQAVQQRAAALSLPQPATREALAAAEKAAAEVERDAEGLRQYADAVEGVTVALTSVARDVNRIREAARGVVSEMDARQSIASSVGSSATARKALEDFAQRFPNSPLSADFAKAAARTALYEPVEAWHQAVLPWAADPAPANEKAAQQRIEEVRAHMDAYPTSPMAARTEPYMAYLQRAAEALAVQSTWQTALETTLSAPMITDLKSLQTTDGTKYYCLQPPNIRRQRLNDRITYSFEVLNPQNIGQAKTITVTPPIALVSEKPELVPHAHFARGLAEQLKTVNRENWESFGPDLASSIAAEEKIEPIVKAILLRQTIMATAQVLEWTKLGLYEKVLGDLVRQRLDQVVWYDPQQPLGEATLNNLKTIFASVPAAADVKKQVLAKRTETFRNLQPVFAARGVGLLLRDASGKWAIEGPSNGRRGPMAYAIEPPPGWEAGGNGAATPGTQPANGAGATPTAPARFVRVAYTQNNELVIDEAVAASLPQGTLVLFTR